MSLYQEEINYHLLKIKHELLIVLELGVNSIVYKKSHLMQDLLAPVSIIALQAI